MAALNKVLLMGNTTREPTLVQTQSGATIAKFGIAINHKWTGKDGTKHDEATFVECAAWDQLANTVSNHLHKGNPVFIEGRLKLDQWQDKQGQKRQQLSVVAEKIQFLGANQSSTRSDGPPATKPPSEPPAEWEPAPAPAADDPVPF